MPNRPSTKIIYKKIPVGVPVPERDFEIVTSQISIKDIEPEEDKIFIRLLFLSVDPYMRIRLRNPSVQGGIPLPIAEVGKPMAGGVIAEVIKTNDPKIKEGEIVKTFANWEEYTIVSTKEVDVKIIHGGRKATVPLSYYLGVFGLTGLAAYVGLHKICEPLQPADGRQQTLFVSAAGGAIGTIVGQYAKNLGMRVVGSTGDDDKVAYLLNELNFDAAFNYKKNVDFDAILKNTCPNGIDIYFDNVGGKMLDAVLLHLNNFARVAISGMISQYGRFEDPEPIRNLAQMIPKRLRIQAFRNTDDARLADDAVHTFTAMMKAGKLTVKETVTEGIENAPKALVDMLLGKNLGKAVVKVADL